MKNVLCFGDSNTYGYDPAGMRDGTAVRYAHDVRWCGVAQRDLGEGWHVIEEGLRSHDGARRYVSSGHQPQRHSRAADAARDP